MDDNKTHDPLHPSKREEAKPVISCGVYLSGPFRNKFLHYFTTRYDLENFEKVVEISNGVMLACRSNGEYIIFYNGEMWTSKRGIKVTADLFFVSVDEDVKDIPEAMGFAERHLDKVASDWSEGEVFTFRQEEKIIRQNVVMMQNNTCRGYTAGNFDHQLDIKGMPLY